MNPPVNRQLATLTLLVLITAFASRPAQAAVLSCTVSGTSVAFGTYTPMQPTALIGTGTVTTVCIVDSQTNTITIGLSAGNSGSFTGRSMTTTLGTTTYPLSYNLYLDAADSQIWGDGSGGSLLATVTRHGNGNGVGENRVTTNLTVYGAVDAAQDPAPGIYTDIITVTVNF